MKPQEIHNSYHITIGDNSHINAISAKNAIDNSVNNIYHFPPELFEQVRSLIMNIHSEYKQDLLDMLAKIEIAKNSNDKKECCNWFGKFLSLASVADCITVAQPLITLLQWLFI